MSFSAVRFNTKDQPEFFAELRKRVNAHFKANNISKHANSNMVLKTIFMCSIYFIPLILMLVGIVEFISGILLMWTIMGFGMAGIGLSIMHDANHGSYSSNKHVNNALGFLLNFLGGYHINWKIQHNVLHHSFTNIEGYDKDIEKPGVFRLSPFQKQRKRFKYQMFYAPFFYILMTVYWCIGKDYEQLNTYNKKNLLTAQGLTFGKALREIIFHKIWYFGLLIVLPFILVSAPWWISLSGFFIMHFICGLLLALIFQAAHVIEETHFFEPSNEGTVENNFAIHQMKTTSNFANTSKWFSWLIGGLNFQIEHHLFPKICHVHYKDISKIVKSTAEEYDIPYNQHKTFGQALVSHFSLLHKLGNEKVAIS